MIARVDVEQLIFLDESGATTQMTRSYARAPRGQRVKEATPQGRWQILTMLAAVTTRGLEVGARLLYLPPYSPDLNPIEQAWSKVKQILRALKARTPDVLEKAVADALAAITPENATGWFSHCGYSLQ